MNECELLTKKFIMVGMDEVAISTLEKPIIGTQALATCVAVLLYSEKNKRAIVAHVSNDLDNIFYQTLMLIDKNGLDNDVLKYKIIPGYYHNHYDIKSKLENMYATFSTMFVPFSEDEIPDNAIQNNINDGSSSCEFAFDSSTGKFVTDRVLFGADYFKTINVIK